MSERAYPRHRKPFSSKASLARDMVLKGKAVKAMEVLERMTTEQDVGRVELAKIAALVADSEVKRGRFSEAVAYYRRASSYYAVDDPRNWFRPRLGEVICLIKAVRADEALEQARETLHLAEQAHASFDRLKRVAERRIQRGLQVEIPPRPIRPCVVGSKLGQAFLQEGEPDAAAEFFRKAVERNPHGGCRARQGLATLALRARDYLEAEKRAEEALLVGKFQAKTVSAWTLLIEARQNLGKRGLESGHLASIRSIQNNEVRGRTVLQVCKDLRSYGDPAWLDVAALGPIGANDRASVCSLQLSRLFLADSRLAQNPREIQRHAIKIATNPHAKAPDVIAALKAYAAAVVHSEAPLSPVWSGVRRLERRWGSRQGLKALHSVGRAFSEAGDVDSAALAFRAVLERCSKRSEAWGRAALALAKVEKARNRYSESLEWLYRYFANDAMPPRFRIQSLLAWIEGSERHRLDDAARLRDAGTTLEHLSASVSDYQTLLDIGRDLSLRGSRFGVLRDSVIRMGTEMAEAEMRAMENPGAYRKILLNLTRREFSDFRTSETVIQRWESMDQRLRLWLWSESSDYWEYLSLVLKSYIYQKRIGEADALATEILSDRAITEGGHAHVASAYAFSLISQNRFQDLVALYRIFVQRHPTHRLAAQAYYWLFIEADLRGARDEAASYALSLRQCFGNKTHFLWEDQLLVRVDLHQSGRPSPDSQANSGFSSEDIENERLAFETDRIRMASHL